jgi:ADP-ribose pyrophosphatase YjhB (NUDIX family)
MITFDEKQTRFTNRVVGIAIHHGRVLLQRAVTDDFWALPGGRAELMEPSAETLRREMREEIQTDVEVERLVYVVENFFHYADRRVHELGLYHVIHLPADSVLHTVSEFEGREGSLRIAFRWFPLEALSDVRVYPTFLREGLKALPAHITHIVVNES